MAGRPYPAVPTNFTAQGTGVGFNNIPQLDADFADLKSNVNDSASGYVNYGTDIGSANTYIVTLTSAPSAYVAGMTIMLSPANANTGASTINVNTLGSVSIVSVTGAALVAGQILPGALSTLVYNGTSFVLISSNDFIGEIKLSAAPAASIPANWLVCNGQAISRTTYAALFSLIGTAYGSGNGSTTFNVPNLTGSFPTQGTPGTTGGSSTISVAQMPVHSHSITDQVHSHTENAHSHGLPANQASLAGSGAGIVYIGNGGGPGQSTFAATATINGSATGITGTNNAGSGAVYYPPYVTFNFIIRAL